MKLKIAMIAIVLLIASKITAQNISVEKTIFGIQTGLLGIWVHNESRLSNAFVLRSELGFDVGFRYSDFYDLNYYVLAPVITAEPRWYYNLEKRNKKGKNHSRKTFRHKNRKTQETHYSIDGLLKAILREDC